MKTACTILLAAALVGGASSKRLLQDVPVVGVGPTSAPTSTTSLVETETDELDLVDALEADDQVTVVSRVSVGELLCDSLVEAEDAESLSFVLLDDEIIFADMTSYTVTDGEAFTDGIGRKVWTGVVTDPEQADDEAVPRTISMTWGEICNTETFLLKVTKRNLDDTTSIIKTVPCFGSTTATCLVEVLVEFEESGDAILPDDDVAMSSSTTSESTSTSGSSAGDTRSTTAANMFNRRLQEDTTGDTVIDVMVLYSASALTSLGGITPQQMETIILEGLIGTDQAFINSDVSVSMNPVYIGLLPYEVTTTDSATTLTDFQSNTNVGILRDSVGADLVQLVTDIDNSCGRGYLFFSAAYGYSIVQATCIDNYSHTHEFGHNLGCYHNRDDSSTDTEYAHAYRYCDGLAPYRTVMSYTCGTPRVNYFSNPDVEYLARPTGTLTEDNARAIEDNMAAVSNYRNGQIPPTPAPTTAYPTTTSPTSSPTFSPTTSPTVPATTTVPPSSTPPTTAPPTTAPPTSQAPTSTPTWSPTVLPTLPLTAPPTISTHPTAYVTPTPTTAPATIEPPTTYTYVGCYVDSSRDRVLTGDFVKGDSGMTIEVCAEFCEGSTYFGPEYGQECFCSDELDIPDRLGDGRCTYNCAGDATQTCGGFNAISVYQYEAVTPAEYLGCWTDSKGNRIMDFEESRSSMTNDLCGEICSDYAFYGTQYGQECWCGDASTDHTTHGESVSCTFQCAGDSDTLCGGYNAMSVWQY